MQGTRRIAEETQRSQQGEASWPATQREERWRSSILKATYRFLNIDSEGSEITFPSPTPLHTLSLYFLFILAGVKDLWCKRGSVTSLHLRWFQFDLPLLFNAGPHLSFPSQDQPSEIFVAATKVKVALLSGFWKHELAQVPIPFLSSCVCCAISQNTQSMLLCLEAGL